MEAFRKTVKVVNNTISIVLPDNFNAEEVDVIILPSQNKEYFSPQWQIDAIREPTKKYLQNAENATDIDDFTVSEEDKIVLDFRANQPKEDFISAEESIDRLKKKYGI